MRGTQTAVVVGADDPTHTDRDLRIKVQFPWQRGSRSASRNGHRPIWRGRGGEPSRDI